MSEYDQMYEQEAALFGQPYPEFVKLVRSLGLRGEVLDLGCGQGRDTLLLARQGLRVTAVDASAVGVAQVAERAAAEGLAVTAVVADFFTFDFPQMYDVVVLDSILHFGKEQADELVLLDKVATHTHDNGIVFLFIHKSPAKEKVLWRWFATLADTWVIIERGYIDYVYEEQASGFRSAFQYCMLVIQRVGSREANDE